MKIRNYLKNNFVYWVSIIIIAIIILFSFLNKDLIEIVSLKSYDYITDRFSWMYLIAMLFFVVFIIVIAFGKYGATILGEENEAPEYSMGYFVQEWV